MKKFFLLVILAIAAYFIYQKFSKKPEAEREKPKPLAVSKHGDAFNQSLENILNDYYAMADGFVNWDSTLVNAKASDLQKSLNDFKVDDLKVDSIIHQTALFPWENTKTNALGISTSGTWDEKRRAFKDLSENLQTLLITVKYDRNKIYWQECPMAFGDDQPANWLSKTEEVINPYLGNKDPKYGNSMLHCGQTKMTIDFLSKDSTTKL